MKNIKRFSVIWSNITEPLALSDDVLSFFMTDCSVCLNLKDSTVWKWDPNGKYSPKSFCMSYLDSKMQRCQWWKEVWAGLAPSKVEALCWQIMFGKLAVKSELVLQQEGIESISHLFFLCELSRQLKRNELVFNGGSVSVEEFNVDGSAMGKPGPAGIEGLLRDHEGNVILRFMKSIGHADSNLAELLAIKEVFLIFASSRWANSHVLIVESDSQSAVKWVNYLGTMPGTMRRFGNQIECFKLKIKEWRVNHILEKPI
ncbi:hypothetical protein PTKIN_Ptkin07bG0108800 [Pterospermum kingtungense]